MNYLDHNGTITIHSARTGEHRTFQIRTMQKDSKFAPGQRILEILDGPDNQSDYRSFAFVDSTPYAGNRAVVYKRLRRDRPCDRLSAYEVFALMLEHPEQFEPKGYTYLQSRCCRKCNRKLTTPESIDAGIGPDCAGRNA